MWRGSKETFSKGRLSLKLVAELQVPRLAVYHISFHVGGRKISPSSLLCPPGCTDWNSQLGSKQSSSVSPTELYCKEKGFILHVHSAPLTASKKKKTFRIFTCSNSRKSKPRARKEKWAEGFVLYVKMQDLQPSLQYNYHSCKTKTGLSWYDPQTRVLSINNSDAQRWCWRSGSTSTNNPLVFVALYWSFTSSGAPVSLQHHTPSRMLTKRPDQFISGFQGWRPPWFTLHLSWNVNVKNL